MTRPNDALYRLRVSAFATLRYLLPPLALFALALWLPQLFDYPWGGILSLVVLAFGIPALWSMQALSLYPAHTFGVEHRVEEDTFDGPRKRCAECGEETRQGLRRRYARQAVVLGVPIHTLEWGINDYCLDCARPGGGPGVDPRSNNGRVRTANEDAERELDRAFE